MSTSSIESLYRKDYRFYLTQIAYEKLPKILQLQVRVIRLVRYSLISDNHSHTSVNFSQLQNCLYNQRIKDDAVRAIINILNHYFDELSLVDFNMLEELEFRIISTFLVREAENK